MGKIDFIGASGIGEDAISPLLVIAILAVYVLIVVGLYLLRSFGLYSLAKREGLKCKKFAFVPFLWVYVMAKLIGKAYFFGKEFKSFAVVVTLISTIASVLDLVVTFFAYFPLIGYYFSGGEILISLAEVQINATVVEYPLVSGVFVRAAGMDGGFVMPYTNLMAVIRIMNAFDIISSVLTFVYSLATIFIYIFLFRKYWPREAVVAVVLCVLFKPLFPILIFCLRKKEPMTREEYLRSIGVINPYETYNPTNPNNTTGINGQTYKRPEETNPFEDFPDKNKPSDPFSEFDKKD